MLKMVGRAAFVWRPSSYVDTGCLDAGFGPARLVTARPALAPDAKNPGIDSTQALMPLVLANVPAWHSVHAACPDWSVTVPGEQASGVVIRTLGAWAPGSVRLQAVLPSWS